MARTAKRQRAAQPRAVVIHAAGDARAALAAAAALGVPVRLESAPGAAAAAGAAWFAALVRAAAAARPDAEFEAVLDCGDAAGHALAALRQGVRVIRFTGPRVVREKIAAIARRSGARVEGARRGGALDLARVPPERAAAALGDWLSGGRR